MYLTYCTLCYTYYFYPVNSNSGLIRFLTSLRILGCASRNCLTSTSSISCISVMIPSTLSLAEAWGALGRSHWPLGSLAYCSQIQNLDSTPRHLQWMQQRNLWDDMRISSCLIERATVSFQSLFKVWSCFIFSACLERNRGECRCFLGHIIARMLICCTCQKIPPLVQDIL